PAFGTSQGLTRGSIADGLGAAGGISTVNVAASRSPGPLPGAVTITGVTVAAIVGAATTPVGGAAVGTTSRVIAVGGSANVATDVGVAAITMRVDGEAAAVGAVVGVV